MGRRLDPRLAGHRWTKHVVAQGIRTLEHLAALTEAELLEVKGVGPAAAELIADLLWEHDLHLAGADQDVEPDPEERAVDLQPTSAAGDEAGPVERSVRARVEVLPEHLRGTPYSAIAVRLAVELDDMGNAAVAKELRATLAYLNDLAPPTKASDDVDEIARHRRHRDQRQA